jgi:hypothetical protein
MESCGQSNRGEKWVVSLTNFFEPFPIDRITFKLEEIVAFDPCPPDEKTMESGLDSTGKRFADATAL